jgi:hypothetical protein
VLAEPEVRRQRRVAQTERAALQSAVSVQARRLTRGIARYPPKAAALSGAEYGRQGRSACPRDPGPLRQRRRQPPGRRAPGRIPAAATSASRGMRRSISTCTRGRNSLIGRGRSCRKGYWCLCFGVLNACLNIAAGWSSPVARQAHNLKVVGSNPAPATKFP